MKQKQISEQLEALLKTGELEQFNPKLSSSSLTDEHYKQKDNLVNALSERIIALLNNIKDLNPKHLKRKGWFDEFVGAWLKREVDFEYVRLKLDDDLRQAGHLYNKVIALKQQREHIMQDMEADLAQIDNYMAVISDFLANREIDTSVYFDNRERLERKLESLTTIKLNLNMNLEQFKLVGNSINQVLDRYQETVGLLNSFKKHLSQGYQSSSKSNLVALEQQYQAIFGAKK